MQESGDKMRQVRTFNFFIIFIFAICVFLSGGIGWSSVDEDILDESNGLAEAYLNGSRFYEGIEYFGGPFSIDNYKTETKRIGTSGKVKIKYCPEGPIIIGGDPKSFEVTVYKNANLPLQKEEEKIAIDKKAFADAGFSESESESIIKVLPRLPEKTFGDVSLVTIDSNGAIKRTKEAGVRIHSVHRIDPKHVRILYSPGYDSRYFYSVLGKSRLRFRLKADVWEPVFSEEYLYRQGKFEEQRFVLYSFIDIPDESLRGLVKRVMQIRNIFGIKAIDTDNNYATIYIFYSTQVLSRNY